MRPLLALIISLLLVLPAMAAPQPYVPQSGDLAPQDQPSTGTRRQVQQNADSYRGLPVYTPQPYQPTAIRPVTPVTQHSIQPGQQPFVPKPYVPDPTPAVPAVPTAPAAPAIPLTTPTAPVVPVEPETPVQPMTPTTPETPVQPVAPVTPPPGSVPQPAVNDLEAIKSQLETLLNQALQSYNAKGCPALLNAMHPQVYVLVRNSWGEQGILGHKQFQDAYCKQVSAANAPSVKLLSHNVEVLKAERARMWGKLEAQMSVDGQTLKLPASFEVDLLKEGNKWLITDAIIQHESP